jgi:manganese transport protein
MVFLDPSRADFVLDRTRACFRGPRAPRPALARLLEFAGPTFIASVTYLDPGNFATNITAGATRGYQLLWVVLVANVMAMLFQALSAKLGIVTAAASRALATIGYPHH